MERWLSGPKRGVANPLSSNARASSNLALSARLRLFKQMIIKFSETTKTTAEGDIWDYPINKDVGLSYQILNSRGPKSGKYLNKVCQEIYFIIKGTAVFYINDNRYEVKEKDVVIVEPNTPFHIETNRLEYIIVTRPDWYEEQYQEID